MFFCFGFPATKKITEPRESCLVKLRTLKTCVMTSLLRNTSKKLSKNSYWYCEQQQKNRWKNPPNKTKPLSSWYGGFLKWWYPTTMGFPTKNDHFGVFRGYHHLRQHPYDHSQPRNPSFPRFLTCALRFVVIFRTSRCGGKQPLGGHTPPLPEWRSWKVHRDLKTTLNNLSGPHLKTNPTQILM